jgi:TPR repeat protein
MRACLLACVLLGAGPLFGTLPPEIAPKQLEKGVTLYERAAPAQTVSSYWDDFLAMFGIGKTAKAIFPFGRSVAVLVGIGNYKYITPSLPFVFKDIQKMLEYLLTQGDFDAVYVMDEQATPQLVDKYMTQNLMHVGKEDRLLFYFSGHGNELDGLPVLQFQEAHPGDWDEAHILRVDQYEMWSRTIPAKHVLLIYDACFAGLAVAVPKTENDDTRASIAELSGKGSRTVVTAGSGEQRAWIEQVSSDLQFSVFTEALIQALRAGADDRNRGFFTIEQAVANAGPRMADMTRKFGPGHEMKPVATSIDSRLTGDFVFLNSRASKPTLPPGDATSMGIAVAKGGSPDLERQIDLALWTSIVDLRDPRLYEDYLRRFPEGSFSLVAKTLMEKYRPAVPSALDKASLADLTRLADLGDQNAMTQLGRAYESGDRGARKDVKKAITYYSQAAQKGDGAAAHRLGSIYYWGREGVPIDPREAARWFQRGAELSDPDSVTDLGFMYNHGLGGLVLDEHRALELYQKAADLGNSAGIANLGAMYEYGSGGLAVDKLKAVELFQKAADLGSAGGIANLGWMYENGWGGLPVDKHEAVELFQKATDLGSGLGAMNLGVMYQYGLGGLPVDEHKAVELYQKAADLGNARGMANLGWMYENGRGGLGKDQTRAVTFYEKAAALGDDYAQTQLQRLGKAH